MIISEEEFSKDVNRMIEFVKKHKMYPRITATDKDEKYLGLKVSSYSSMYKAGTLGEKRHKIFKILKEEKIKNDKWFHRYEILKKYDSRPKEVLFLNWCYLQLGRMKQGLLSKEKKAKLEEISWFKDLINKPSKADKLKDKMNELLEFFNNNGRFPSLKNPDERSLHSFFKVTKKKVKYGELKLKGKTLEIFNYLSSYTNSSDWNKFIHRLNIWKSSVECSNSYMWMANQRRNFKAGTLHPEKIKKLNETEGWSWNKKREE